MELRWMETFIAVAEELNFGLAARRLHVAQPAVSQTIAKLEAELHTKLFDRNTRGVQLTDAGRAFLEPSRLALEAVVEAKQSAIKAGTGQYGTIRLGYNGAFASDHTEALIAAVKMRFPGIRFDLDHSRYNDEVLQLLVSRRLDLGMIGGEISRPAFSQVRIGTETIGALFPETHPLASEAEVSLERLKNDIFIVVAQSTGISVRSMVLEACQAAGIRPAELLEARDGQALSILVAAGAGIGFGSSASITTRPKGLTWVPLSERLEMPSTVVWLKNNESPALQNVVGIARMMFQPAAR